MKLDLHVHSNYSDGKYTPEELIKLFKNKVDGFALTDHDTINGMEVIEKLKKDYEFIILPGIEFSCNYNDEEIHILGINIDYKNKDIINITKELKEIRYNRGKKIVENLISDNILINTDNILENKTIGRPHIAKELVYKGYARSVDEAFSKFLTKKSKYYVSKEYLEIDDAIKYIHDANGVAILAHPGKINDTKGVINYIENSNIDGIEVYHPSNNSLLINYLLDISIKNNYLITGGSDFHYDIDRIGKFYTDNIKTLTEVMKND